MKQIGIRLADGSFYPIMEDGQKCTKTLGLTTVKDNQTRVIVDVYRSKTGTMEDAEYIDSLQIENLVEHPNGTVDINLDIGLDENGKLRAAMIDPETGNKSSADVTLVSRTVEERLEPTNYEISMPETESAEKGINAEKEDSLDSDKVEAAEAAIAGAALGAVAGGIVVNELNKEAEKSDADIFDLDDTIVEEPVVSDDPNSTAEEPSVEFDSDSTAESEAEIPLEDATQGESSISDDITFDEPLLDDSVPSAESEPAENFAEEKSDDSAETQMPSLENFDDSPVASDFNIDEIEEPKTEESKEDSFSEPDLPPQDETVALEPELPESDETLVSDNASESVPVQSESESSSSESFEDFDLPDFNLPEETAQTETADSLGDDDFLKALDSSNDSQPDDSESSDSIFNNELVNDNTPSNGINFNGLYDKETEQGTSSVSNDEVSESVRKKTKTPVIICLVCAIICLVCAALVLFVVPSKFNLLGKKNSASKEKEVAPIVEEAKPVQEEEIQETVPIQAKEEEVVVAQEPEEVVPEPPAPPVEKPKNITYKIKWGDTLWDIADAYYKNPWRYKYIARYNGIKNPDYIISGTTIVIPAN